MSRLVHVRYDGQSFDLSWDELDIGDLSDDQDVRQKVAAHFQVPVIKLREYAVDRAENEITLRPQAVFG